MIKAKNRGQNQLYNSVKGKQQLWRGSWIYKSCAVGALHTSLLEGSAPSWAHARQEVTALLSIPQLQDPLSWPCSYSCSPTPQSSLWQCPCSSTQGTYQKSSPFSLLTKGGVSRTGKEKNPPKPTSLINTNYLVLIKDLVKERIWMFVPLLLPKKSILSSS